MNLEKMRNDFERWLDSYEGTNPDYWDFADMEAAYQNGVLSAEEKYRPLMRAAKSLLYASMYKDHPRESQAMIDALASLTETKDG